MDYNQSNGIDLHIHSTASDGTVAPSEILIKAGKSGLRAISITDHDTTEGCREALQQGIPTDLLFLSGVEISTNPPPSYPGSGSFHVLGYALDLDDRVLNQMLGHLQDSRKNRNPTIINRLSELGVAISLAEVRAISGRGQIGRPHIAKALLKKQIVPSIDSAFDRYLGYGKPAYVDKARVDFPEAVRTIHNAGGIAILAHPGLLTPPEGYLFETFLDELVAMGIDGLEAYYPEHGEKQTRYYVDLARKKGLLVTGGTDFHGSMKPEIHMGTGTGHFHVPLSVFHSLILRKT